MVDNIGCGGTGFADYAAVPCPDPDCPVPVHEPAGTRTSGTDYADALALIDELLHCFVTPRTTERWTAGVRVRGDLADEFVARRAALGDPGT